AILLEHRLHALDHRHGFIPGAVFVRRCAKGPGRVKTLRGITEPGILRLVVTLRAKKCKNSSSAQRYNQIRFRFHTAWALNHRPPFSGRPSLTGHCGHGWTCSLPRPVAIDPTATLAVREILHVLVTCALLLWLAYLT